MIYYPRKEFDNTTASFWRVPPSLLPFLEEPLARLPTNHRQTGSMPPETNRGYKKDVPTPVLAYSRLPVLAYQPLPITYLPLFIHHTLSSPVHCLQPSVYHHFDVAQLALNQSPITLVIHYSHELGHHTTALRINGPTRHK